MRKILFFNCLFIISSVVGGNVALAADTQQIILPEGAGYLRDTIPGEWIYSDDFTSIAADNGKWWRRFNDATLDTLVDLGLRNNFDIAAAMRRMEIARGNMAIARSRYFPTVGVSAGWTAAKGSGANAQGTPVKTPTDRYFSLGANLSWEIDLFGRINAGLKEKELLWQASRADYEAAMVSVTAEIASEYIQLRVWQSQLNVALRHIETQKKIVALTQARMDAGIGNKLDVTQARTVLLNTQATIPGLENSIHTAINSIALLVGEYGYVEKMTVDLTNPGSVPDYRQLIACGVPAEMLRRRPDVIAAERQLAAAAAALGISKKEFLPTLVLNGTIGTQARKFGDLFTADSFTWSVAPTLSWTLFSGLSRRYDVANARRNMELQIDQYNLTVTTAITEVDNAMSDYRYTVRQIDLLQQVERESHESLDLSVDLYKQGLTNFSNVSDAQLSLLESQSSAISAQGDALTALINLYKALGGGWNE